MPLSFEVNRALWRIYLSAVAEVIRYTSNRYVVNGTEIDLDASGCLPRGLEGLKLLPDEKQIKSRMTGRWMYDPSKLRDHLVRGQMDGLIGSSIRLELEGLSVMRAAVIDFGMANQAMLPESWKDDKVRFAWGDIYCDRGHNLLVRYIRWSDGVWYENCDWISRIFYSGRPAIVLARGI